MLKRRIEQLLADRRKHCKLIALDLLGKIRANDPQVLTELNRTKVPQRADYLTPAVQPSSPAYKLNRRNSIRGIENFDTDIEISTSTAILSKSLLCWALIFHCIAFRKCWPIMTKLRQWS